MQQICRFSIQRSYESGGSVGSSLSSLAEKWPSSRLLYGLFVRYVRLALIQYETVRSSSFAVGAQSPCPCRWTTRKKIAFNARKYVFETKINYFCNESGKVFSYKFDNTLADEALFRGQIQLANKATKPLLFALALECIAR